MITEQFRNYLTQIGYSKSSCLMLPDCVRDFLAYNNITDLKQINQAHINSFYEWLQIRPHKHKQGGLSEIYINHHVYALRVFFTWLEKTEQIQHNPISAIKFKRPVSNSRQPISIEHIQDLFASCVTAKETALLHLFYSCGLRRTEAVLLNSNDIHFKQQLLYVREGKGAKRRVVPMTARVAKELETYYVTERLTLTNVKDHDAFMINRVSERMSGDSYNRELKTILERAEISTENTLHHLRHSIATHLLESGLKLEDVRDFLGHSHLESTQIYTKVNQTQLRSL
jgi:site-specific recombinase XerD